LIYNVYQSDIMTVKLNKWGNSIGLRLPTNIVKALRLETGTEVQVELQNESVIIKPLKSDLTLEWLCEGMDADDMHKEHFNDFEGEEKFWEKE